MKQSGLLIAIGDDEPGAIPNLKIFDLDKPDNDGNPSLIRYKL